MRYIPHLLIIVVASWIILIFVAPRPHSPMSKIDKVTEIMEELVQTAKHSESEENFLLSYSDWPMAIDIRVTVYSITYEHHDNKYVFTAVPTPKTFDSHIMAKILFLDFTHTDFPILVYDSSSEEVEYRP